MELRRALGQMALSFLLVILTFLLACVLLRLHFPICRSDGLCSSLSSHDASVVVMMGLNACVNVNCRLSLSLNVRPWFFEW